MKMKKETPRKKAMKKFKQNENVMENEKSELLFEKIERKKKMKKENEQVERKKENANTEK